jgi:hypothetical protein
MRLSLKIQMRESAVSITSQTRPSSDGMHDFENFEFAKAVWDGRIVSLTSPLNAV